MGRWAAPSSSCCGYITALLRVVCPRLRLRHRFGNRIDKCCQCSGDGDVSHFVRCKLGLEELPKLQCCAYLFGGAIGFYPVIEVLGERCDDRFDRKGPFTREAVDRVVGHREERKLVSAVTCKDQGRRSDGSRDALRTRVADGSVGPMDEVCDLALAAKTEIALHRATPLGRVPSE
jgi:hypothetical protein